MSDPSMHLADLHLAKQREFLAEKCATCNHVRGVHVGKNTGYGGNDTECRHGYKQFTGTEKANDQCLCRQFRARPKTEENRANA
jgi:hypothetical protein